MTNPYPHYDSDGMPTSNRKWNAPGSEFSNPQAYQQRPWANPGAQPGQHNQPSQPGPYGHYSQPTQYGQPAQPGMPQPNYGVNPNYPAPGMAGYPVVYESQKSRALAAILALFLGGFGAHNFYLGYNTKGAIQLALTLFGIATSIVGVGFFILLAVGLWATVELIMLIIGAGPYRSDSQGFRLR